MCCLRVFQCRRLRGFFVFLIDRDVITAVPRTLLGVALLRLCYGGTFGRLGAE